MSTSARKPALKGSSAPSTSETTYSTRPLPEVGARVFEVRVTSGPDQGATAILEAMSPGLAYFNAK